MPIDGIAGMEIGVGTVDGMVIMIEACTVDGIATTGIEVGTEITTTGIGIHITDDIMAPIGGGFE